MFKSIKCLVLICAVFCGVFPAFAQETSKTVPGSVLYIYSYTNMLRPAPDTDPITVVVDSGNKFEKSLLQNNKETSKFAVQSVFLVWNGYITIPAKGIYTFSASFIDGTHYTSENNVIIQISKKDILNISKIHKNFKNNDSKSVILEKGSYEISVINKSPGSYHHSKDFVLKMWNKLKPLKKFEITPASMYHVE